MKERNVFKSQFKNNKVTMSIYKKFATVYDQMDADLHSKIMVPYCKKIFKKFSIKAKTGLDLCCGTGSAIVELEKLGINMSGLDQSATMLAVAAKKTKKLKVPLYQKSLPTFRLLDKKESTKTVQFDLVTSFYDSLNYMLTEKDLEKSFEAVHKHLNKDGWFIFDMNTPLALKTIWDEQIYAGTNSSVAWVWKNEYDQKEKKATCHATFFKKKGKLWERFDETHHEQAYNNTTIQKILKSSGFVIKGFYDCYTFDKATRSSYRICAVVQKK